jgi:hypothetical protein
VSIKHALAIFKKGQIMKQKSKKRLLKMFGSESGSVIIIAALAAAMLITAVGTAVDMSSAQALHNRMLTAVYIASDSLKINNPTMLSADEYARWQANRVFHLNYTNGAFNSTTANLTVTSTPTGANAISVTVAGDSRMTPMFMSALGISSLSIAASNTQNPTTVTVIPGQCNNAVINGCTSGTYAPTSSFTPINATPVSTPNPSNPTNPTNPGPIVSFSTVSYNIGNYSIIQDASANTDSNHTGEFLVAAVCGIDENGHMIGVCDSNPIPPSPTPTTWYCLGTGAGTNASCSTNDPSPGVCGATANSCASGTYIAGNSTSWSCQGVNGGSTATCSNLTPVNGACGSTSGTCNAGKSYALVTQGSYSEWKCLGLNGGNASDLCTSNDPANGACSTQKNTCNVGTAIAPVDNGTTATWICKGVNGGRNSPCNSSDPITGQCGNTTNTCQTGLLQNSTDISLSSGSTQHNWTCKGANGGADSGTCSTTDNNSPINGICGSGHATCSSGTINILDNGNWQCVGVNGGLLVTCADPPTPLPSPVVWTSVGSYVGMYDTNLNYIDTFNSTSNYIVSGVATTAHKGDFVDGLNYTINGIWVVEQKGGANGVVCTALNPACTGRVTARDNYGNIMTTLDLSPLGNGAPNAIATDERGDVYVAVGNTVGEYDFQGIFLQKFQANRAGVISGIGTTPYQYGVPNILVVVQSGDGKGNVCTASVSPSTCSWGEVEIFNSLGVYTHNLDLSSLPQKYSAMVPTAIAHEVIGNIYLSIGSDVYKFNASPTNYYNPNLIYASTFSVHTAGNVVAGIDIDWGDHAYLAEQSGGSGNICSAITPGCTGALTVFDDKNNYILSLPLSSMVDDNANKKPLTTVYNNPNIPPTAVAITKCMATSYSHWEENCIAVP